MCDERSVQLPAARQRLARGLVQEEQVAFGTDEDIGGENRSDTIILVHTEPGQRQAVFLSFPRDLWVEIPVRARAGSTRRSRAGSTATVRRCVARTIKGLTGLRINHVLYVDLARFQGLVDTLDGVDMCVPRTRYRTHAHDGLELLEAGRMPPNTGSTAPRRSLRGAGRRTQAVRLDPGLRPDRPAAAVPARRDLRAALAVGAPRSSPPSSRSSSRTSWWTEGLANPAELVYLAGQLNGVNTGAADFRSVPSSPGGDLRGRQYLSIVRAVEPDATRLFRRISRASRSAISAGTCRRSAVPGEHRGGGRGPERGRRPPCSTSSPRAGSTRPRASSARARWTRPVRGAGDRLPRGAGGRGQGGRVLRSCPRAGAGPASALPDGVDVAVVANAAYEIPPPDTSGGQECPS